MITITHFLFGLGILLSSFSVICLGDSPVLAAVFLIITFVLAAIYLILIGIGFIGITYIILYVGAIAVLFLFVIMMLNLRDKDLIEPSSVTFNNGIYSLSIVILFASLINFIPSLPFKLIDLIALDFWTLMNFSFLDIKEISLLNQLPTFNLLQQQFKINESQSDIALIDLTQIETLGHDLYTYGAVLLISLSIILLLAMYATIIISKPNAK